ncbi:MAG: hypothetical protein ACLP07_11470 [Terracidiphilus sp.]
MTEELKRNLSVIHDLERAIRVWELVRARTQQVVIETSAYFEKQGEAFQSNPAVAKACVDLTKYDWMILRAKEQIDKLESEN